MISQAIHGVQTKEIERIGKLIAGGLDSADLLGAKSRGRLFAYRNQLRSRLIEIMTKAGNFGSGQVNAELARQGVG